MKRYWVNARPHKRGEASDRRAQWAPSVGRRVLRHPTLWWVLAIALALSGAAVLRDRAADLDQARAAWGERVAVVIVSRDVAVGEALLDSVEVATAPRSIVPTSAVAPMEETIVSSSSVARVPLIAGEILLTDRVAGVGDRLIEDGQVALTVTLANASPMVVVGDLVDVWSVDVAAGRSAAVARRVRVVDRAGSDLTVAVDQRDVGPLVLAALRPVTVALVG